MMDKKYIKLIPLILYPYVWLVFLLLLIYGPWGNMGDIVKWMLEFLGIVWLIYSLIVAIISCVRQKDYTPKESAFMNMMVKLLQIPAYIINFIVGIIGVPMIALWGLGVFVIFCMIIVDVSAIALTGIQSIGVGMNLCRSQVLGKGLCVFCIICSFLFCIDVVTAVLMYSAAKKNYVGS